MFISAHREQTHGSREWATTQKTWLHGVLLLVSKASTCASLTPRFRTGLQHHYSHRTGSHGINRFLIHQQKTTLLAGVLASTYWTCSLLQAICKEKFCKFRKLGQFLTTCLAIKLAEKSPGFQLNVISHLQVAARHTSFSHFFVLFTKKKLIAFKSVVAEVHVCISTTVQPSSLSQTSSPHESSKDNEIQTAFPKESRTPNKMD